MSGKSDYGRVVFKEEDGIFFRPVTGEIVWAVGTPITNTQLERRIFRHEKAHAVYYNLSSEQKLRLYEAFEKEIGYENYMKTGRTHSIAHPDSYYSREDGSLRKGRIITEAISMMVEIPGHLQKYTPDASEFRKTIIEFGLHTPTITLRKIQKS